MEPMIHQEPEMLVIAAIAGLLWLVAVPITLFVGLRACWRYWDNDPRDADSLWHYVCWQGFSSLLHWIWKGKP